MNRHELGKQIVQEALTDSEPLVTWVPTILQKRPYTAVQITHIHENKEYSAIGFTKVCWPDKWDEQYGLEMAVKKAAHDIARQICGERV